ncbi:MAG: hypothetical protein ACOCUU_00620 [Nanoarchaeota archaeon]
MSKKDIIYKNNLVTRPSEPPLPKELIVGGDDSNHTGDPKNTKGDIIVSVFSQYKEDGKVYAYPNKRDISRVDKWLSYPGRDYFFTRVLNHDCMRSNTVVQTQMPRLIQNYILIEDIDLNKIRCYVDGRLCGTRSDLRNKITDSTGIEKVVVDNFIKKTKNNKGNIMKRPVCPAVVYVADTIANNLFNLSIQELIEHEKYVP